MIQLRGRSVPHIKEKQKLYSSRHVPASLHHVLQLALRQPFPQDATPYQKIVRITMPAPWDALRSCPRERSASRAASKSIPALPLGGEFARVRANAPAAAEAVINEAQFIRASRKQKVERAGSFGEGQPLPPYPDPPHSYREPILVRRYASSRVIFRFRGSRHSLLTGPRSRTARSVSSSPARIPESARSYVLARTKGVRSNPRAQVLYRVVNRSLLATLILEADIGHLVPRARAMRDCTPSYAR
ncbi:hypothetical protein GGS21DRAFT_242796 [Xylaria nigripes]|nr:hypothetical protein GGS21DRAFT_242796 [Xylaria nigripes]